MLLNDIKFVEFIKKLAKFVKKSIIFLDKFEFLVKIQTFELATFEHIYDIFETLKIFDQSNCMRRFRFLSTTKVI